MTRDMSKDDPRTCSLAELIDTEVNAETDDYVIARHMAGEIAGARPEYLMAYLAEWAARLRIRYTHVGRELGANKLD
jgi:hypothetical protein